MTDQRVRDERAAAKQDLTQLLVDILVPPLKTEVSTLLEENIYPLERSILERQDRLEAQAGKVTRFIAKHYPESSIPLEEQLQTLEFAQQDAHELAQSHNSKLLELLGQHSQQSGAIQTSLTELLAEISEVESHQIAAQEQARRLSDAGLQGVTQLTRSLASFEQRQQQAHSQAVAAVQAMGATAASKLDHYQQQQQSQWLAASHKANGIQTGIEELAQGLAMADARRITVEDHLQRLGETNQEGVSQLTQQLASLILAQQQAQEVLHETMRELDDAAAGKFDSQQQRLAELFTVQQQAHSDLQATMQALNEAMVGKLNLHQQQLQKHWLTVHGSAQQHLNQGFGSLLDQLRELNKQGIRRLEKLTLVTAEHFRIAVHKEVSAQGQQLQDLWLKQSSSLHERLAEQLQALSAADAHNQVHHAQTLALKAQVDSSQKHLKWVLYGCTALVMANLGGLLYLMFGR